MAYWVFGAVGLGMASPYLVIGAFPRLIRFLPKPGAWMDTFKQFMGFLLLATVVYLFNTLTAALLRADLDAAGGAVVCLLVDRPHAVDGRPAMAGGGLVRRLGRGGPGGTVRLHRAPSGVENPLAAVFAGGPGAGPRRGQDRDGRLHGQLVPELQDQFQAGHRDRRRGGVGSRQWRGADVGRLDGPVADDQEGAERSGLQFDSFVGDLARPAGGERSRFSLPICCARARCSTR